MANDVENRLSTVGNRDENCLIKAWRVKTKGRANADRKQSNMPSVGKKLQACAMLVSKQSSVHGFTEEVLTRKKVGR